MLAYSCLISITKWRVNHLEDVEPVEGGRELKGFNLLGRGTSIHQHLTRQTAALHRVQLDTWGVEDLEINTATAENSEGCKADNSRLCINISKKQEGISPVSLQLEIR